MLVSNCCGVYAVKGSEDIEICPECLEHCEYVQEDELEDELEDDGNLVQFRSYHTPLHLPSLTIRKAYLILSAMYIPSFIAMFMFIEHAHPAHSEIAIYRKLAVIVTMFCFSAMNIFMLLDPAPIAHMRMRMRYTEHKFIYKLLSYHADYILGYIIATAIAIHFYNL